MNNLLLNNMINYAHPKFASSPIFKSLFEMSNLTARSRFDRCGKHGAHGPLKEKRVKKPPYIPGQGCGAPTPTGQAKMFQGRRPGDFHRMIIYTDGSLRHEK